MLCRVFQNVLGDQDGWHPQGTDDIAHLISVNAREDALVVLDECNIVEVQQVDARRAVLNAHHVHVDAVRSQCFTEGSCECRQSAHGRLLGTQQAHAGAPGRV
jgi:hypothetical protein